MNEDPTSLESELRGLQPMPPSRQLQQRLASLMDVVDTVCSRPRMPWWQRLGFNRPAAALCWGVLSPCAAACLAMAVAADFWTTPRLQVSPVTSVDTNELGEQSSTPLAGGSQGNQTDMDAHGIKAVNVLYQTLDEGVVLNGRKEPVRRVRYRSADHVRWHNPQTGAQWEISYPREDVLFIPVEAE